MGIKDYFDSEDSGGDLSQLSRYEDSLLGDTDTWTNADEDALEEFEEERRQKLAERSEY
jgi:hypothetical protein